MKILVIDNHDSFVYNITGLLHTIRNKNVFPDFEWRIVLNDEVNPDDAMHYDGLILSPGPGIPEEAGNLMEVVQKCVGHVPILGICLGFQAIAESYGALLSRLSSPRHGHLSHLVNIDRQDPLIGALADSSPSVGRYHSWIVKPSSLPEELIPTSFDEEGNLMSFRHKILPLFGTQFHPESIITDCGQHIFKAFLSLVSKQCK